MGVDYSKFDKAVDIDKLRTAVNQAKEYEDVPKGTYVVSFEKMEIKLTKAGDKLMFAVQCKIKEGEYKGRMIFFNRVISGNTSNKWTDAQAIKSVCTWLDHLETDIIPTFVSYDDFADLVLDIFQEVQGGVEAEVDYDAKAFESISILEAFDCNG